MTNPAAEAEKLTDDAIDSELSMAVLGYDPSDKYPEWSNGSMRFAYRVGFEDGYREALKARPEFCSDCGGDHSRIMQHEVRQIAADQFAELIEAHDVSMCGNVGVPGMPNRLELKCPTCGPIPDDGRQVFKQHAAHVSSIMAAFFREHFTEEMAQ